MSIDHLSALPDSLLILVLDHLKLKEAVRTSVLAKRWRSLWADFPRLNISLVRTALVSRTLNHLNGFQVKFDYQEGVASDVNTWLECAVNYKTEWVKLLLRKHYYELPQMMYSNSSLTKLSLKRCVLAPGNTIEWPYLTSLEIDHALIPQGVIDGILSNCSVLRQLILRRCWGFSRLEINSESLRRLTIEENGGKSSEPLLEIWASDLYSLTISMCRRQSKLRLNNKPTLASARIKFNNNGWSDDDITIQRMISKVEQFLKLVDSFSNWHDDDSITVQGISKVEQYLKLVDSFPHWHDDDSITVESMIALEQLLEQLQLVWSLFLDDGILKTISRMEVSGRRMPQLSVHDMDVRTSDDPEEDFSGIVALLKSSPELEYLTLSYHHLKEEDNTWNPAARDHFVPDLYNLKNVRISMCGERSIEPLLTMAQILLKKATVLEQMMIVLYGCSQVCFTETSQKLQSYPRISQKAQVLTELKY